MDDIDIFLVVVQHVVHGICIEIVELSQQFGDTYAFTAIKRCVFYQHRTSLSRSDKQNAGSCVDPMLKEVTIQRALTKHGGAPTCSLINIGFCNGPKLCLSVQKPHYLEV